MTARVLVNVPAKAQRGEIIQIKTLISTCHGAGLPGVA